MFWGSSEGARRREKGEMEKTLLTRLRAGFKRRVFRRFKAESGHAEEHRVRRRCVTDTPQLPDYYNNKTPSRLPSSFRPIRETRAVEVLNPPTRWHR